MIHEKTYLLYFTLLLLLPPALFIISTGPDIIVIAFNKHDMDMARTCREYGSGGYRVTKVMYNRQPIKRTATFPSAVQNAMRSIHNVSKQASSNL